MGIPEAKNNLFTLRFADDQIVIAQDNDDLEYMARILIEEYKKWGLEVNIEKTRYMNIGGLEISDDGRLDQAIKKRNSLGRRAITRLNSIIWDQHISKSNKHRIYNTTIKSIVTYGSEVWQLKASAEKTLEATEMDFWRRAAGRSKLERFTNNRIREIMGVTHTITQDIKINQLRWYGHVRRMEDQRLPKQILDWTPQGRRKKRRPRKSWREGFNREIRERELDEDLWMDRG
ncbi:uncharacterized protein LOC123685289 [Harmonia axyridis]|uniref:uncharacterized protein LOC123685289 n=1 Tax=Harmonia axyridis TaxID=115357 RepID=UPI001E275B1B|nr:uncharacterized protein LOC123685289 [Harmonia axyridis]